ncbi:hypothetical protein [Actomonas aquatica]|uniref:Flagellar hook-length control protein FliK n=1 Tax=Actomonas aquatica TaxID=2866162 RepID=A0ABZ1CDL4_9BACT|nr:hypothetical protein [Opitutus sp. WL0086]WRQ89377.1 hypothetical protein K1X11_008145 [Opitutus sp. WL0086]
MKTFSQPTQSVFAAVDRRLAQGRTETGPTRLSPVVPCLSPRGAKLMAIQHPDRLVLCIEIRGKLATVDLSHAQATTLGHALTGAAPGIRPEHATSLTVKKRGSQRRPS